MNGYFYLDIGNRLTSQVGVRTQILLLKLHRFLKITQVSGHSCNRNCAESCSFFPGHTGNMGITGAVSLFFRTY